MSHAVPYDFHDAKEACARASRAQAEAERARAEANDALAEKERIYRIALARRIVEHHAEGVAWTVAGDLARGDEKVAQLRYERDVAKGVADVSEQRAWRHSADRRDVLALVEWSARAPDGHRDLRNAA